MKKNRRVRSSMKPRNIYLRISIIAMAVFFGVMLTLYLHLSAKTDKQERQDEKPKPGTYSRRNIPEIKFRRDGSLRFDSPQGAEKAVIEIEIVATELSRTRGLMFRKEMQNDRGMLFLFPSEMERSFWMKNTYIPLDIIFTDKDGKIVHIAKNTTPLTEDMIPCPDPAIFVVEVNAGYTDMNDIRVGDIISWTED